MKTLTLVKQTAIYSFIGSTVLFAPLASQALTVEEVTNPRQNNGGWVTDMADILSDRTEGQLNQMIVELENRNGTEIAVVTVPETTPAESPKTFATQLFNYWGIGKAEENNGVLFLISTGDKRVEIETGYGIEAILPHTQVGNIIGTVENLPAYTLVTRNDNSQESNLSQRSKISDGLHRKIDKELEPGELIKWVDQPVPRFFTVDSTYTFFFGIVWTAFSIFWVVGASSMTWSSSWPSSSSSKFFPLFGIPFILVGFWMLSSPIQVWYKAHQTAYIITDKRAILIEGDIRRTTISSYLPTEFEDVHRRENKDGTGDVIIKTQLVTHWSTDADGHRSKDTKEKIIGFMTIRNPKQVERMLKELAKTAV
jgi:TPM domain